MLRQGNRPKRTKRKTQIKTPVGSACGPPTRSGCTMQSQRRKRTGDAIGSNSLSNGQEAKRPCHVSLNATCQFQKPPPPRILVWSSHCRTVPEKRPHKHRQVCIHVVNGPAWFIGSCSLFYSPSVDSFKVWLLDAHLFCSCIRTPSERSEHKVFCDDVLFPFDGSQRKKVFVVVEKFAQMSMQDVIQHSWRDGYTLSIHHQRPGRSSNVPRQDHCSVQPLANFDSTPCYIAAGEEMSPFRMLAFELAPKTNHHAIPVLVKICISSHCS